MVARNHLDYLSRLSLTATFDLAPARKILRSKIFLLNKYAGLISTDLDVGLYIRAVCRTTRWNRFDVLAEDEALDRVVKALM